MAWVAKLGTFIVPFIILLFLKVDPNDITNLKDILMGSIGLGASSLGFFIAGVSIMQTSNFSRFYSSLVELGTNKKITGWLMCSIGYLFILTFLSVFLLFIEPNLTGVLVYLFYVWLSVLFAAFLSGLYVTLIIVITFSK